VQIKCEQLLNLNDESDAVVIFQSGSITPGKTPQDHINQKDAKEQESVTSRLLVDHRFTGPL